MSDISYTKLFKIYKALFVHFNNEKYNFLESRAKLKSPGKIAKYEEHIFNSIIKKYPGNEINFLISNFIDGNTYCQSRSLKTQEANDIYINWRKRIDTLSRQLDNDLNIIKQELNKNGISIKEIFYTNQNDPDSLPEIWKYTIEGTISKESLILILKSTNLFDKYCKILSNSQIWNKYSFRLKKYDQLMKFNEEPFKNKIVNYLKEANTGL